MEKKRKILIIVENLPVPFDTRVWQEATTLAANGYTVSVICPVGKGYTEEEEVREGVHIFRHKLPPEGNGAVGYFREYGTALKEELRLARKVYREIGFDVIHGCNPPDDIYLVAQRFKKYGVRYVFDHHDICPELFEAKFGSTKGLLYKSQVWLERETYRHCTFASSRMRATGKLPSNGTICARTGSLSCAADPGSSVCASFRPTRASDAAIPIWWAISG